MTSKITKGIFLGLLVLACMSVVVASDVVDNATSDTTYSSSTDTPVDTTTSDIASNDVSTYNNRQSNEIQNEEENEEEEEDDPYTFSNTNLTITGNNYDGRTLILLDNVNVTSSNIQLAGTNFIISGNNVNLNGLNIVTYNYNVEAITITGSNVTVNGTNIIAYKSETGKVNAISTFNTSNVTISNNNIYVSGVPQENNWTRISMTPSHSVDNPFVDAIEVWNSNYINIENNNITVKNSTISSIINSTAKAIILNNNTRNSNITNNKININGFDFIHAISLCYNIDNVKIDNNEINMNGTNYIGGLFGDYVTNSIISENTITGECYNTSSNIASKESLAYGINIFTEDSINLDNPETSNITIAYNNIYLNSTIVYGIEGYFIESTSINNNDIILDANKAIGIAMALHQYSSITSNNIQINSHDDRTLENVNESIPPITSGIFCISTWNEDGSIINNTINITENASSDEIYAISLHSTGFNNISENYLGTTFVNGSLEANNAIYQNDYDDSEIGVNYPLNDLNIQNTEFFF